MARTRKLATSPSEDGAAASRSVHGSEQEVAPILPVSASFYQALIEQTNDLVSVLSADGVIRYASPSYQRMLGYGLQDLIGKNAFTFIHADDLAALRARYRVATTNAGQTTSNQYRMRHADGSWRTLEAVGTNLLDDASVAGVVINARDVTDRVRAEALLTSQSEILADRLAELELLYHTAPVGLALVGCDLRFVRINDRLAAINGLSPAAHIGRSLREVVPALADSLEPVYRRVIETGEPVIALNVRGATPAAPGVEKDWLVSYYRLEDRAGAPLGVSVVVLEITELKAAERSLQEAQRDLEARVHERTAALVTANDTLRAEIAERQRAEQSLRQSEARYRHLVENINEVIFTVDPSGTITYISPAIERVVRGRSASDVVGRSFLDFIHPDDGPVLVESFQRLLSGQPEPLEYRAIGPEGQVYWLSSQSQAIIEDGCVVAVQGVLTDVTARRDAEQEARQQREGLAHVQRLTTAGAMTAEIAHQINQPLAAIVNFAGGLATRLRDGHVQPEAMRDVATRIADEAHRAGEVIRRLRAFLRKGESVLRDCDLNHLVRHVYRLLEEEFCRATVEVSFQLDRQLPLCHVDAILIEQVFLNLLRNALDALVGGADPRRVCIATRVVGEMVQVAVSDTGVGLPADAATRVFEAFYTTKPDGLGLGLSVSRSIIHASGGRLWVEPNAPRGATVAFALPRGPDSEAEVS